MKKRYAYRLLRENTWQVRLAMLERVKGIEPSYRAWEALVLPLNYTRFEMCKAL